ncbi:MAG: methylmalonyl-CoA/ethylmalonyl-CoA epimerase [Thermoplasmata archaeon]|jgi:methylmalonyl-CoA/ethylmalonyl-CoA epimerase|nr:methylmalonyl-CoA/ethylmalonyl-CoA epimerase [Thermoplasmata archaeon]
MKVKRVDHLGIAVSDLAAAKRLYEDLLGLTLTREEVVQDQGVRTHFYPIAGLKLELLESIDPDGPIAKHLEKRGAGLQHVAVEVEDVEAAIAELKAKGVRMIDETPRKGVEGSRIAFVHPKDTHGVLLELVELP